ncbi:hypothetical protein ACFFF7_06850 [Novosphingobium aquiterrae]|uniref:DUF4386 family protein n=1 Tax=Novosphingobium aquiterrae TaxID=624388 RepID=A0ABV6PH10_9SPHN
MRLGNHPLTALLFATTVAVLALMQSYFPTVLAIPLPGSNIRPVLLLEMASQPQHLIHIFGPTDDPLRPARISGMNTGNAIDYLLMVSYALLTLSFFFGIAQELGSNIWRLFGWLGVIAALADATENWLMFRMVAHIADPSAEMAVLPYPVWIKFGLLALTCGAAAWAFVGLRRWALAALSLPAIVMLIPGFLDPLHVAPMATALIGLGWLAMALHAVSRWWSSRRTARPAA